MEPWVSPCPGASSLCRKGQPCPLEAGQRPEIQESSRDTLASGTRTWWLHSHPDESAVHHFCPGRCQPSPAGGQCVNAGTARLAAKGASPGPFQPQESVPGKAGRCPAGSTQEPRPSKLYCLSDASCPGDEKCCSLGPMRICTQPALVNPGYCPTACPTALEPCRVFCLDDVACGPGEKCCLQDCQLWCVVAERARPGLCPRRRVLPTGTPCPNRCEDDRGCPPGHKCCFTGCGLECLRPRAVDFGHQRRSHDLRTQRPS